MEEAQRALLERHSEFDEAIRELHRAEAALGEEVTGLAIIESHAGRLLGGTPRVCSFCGASQRDVARLIAGPLFYICEGCVTAAIQTIETRGADASRILPISTTAAAACSFCGKAHCETEHLVTASRGGRICDECLEVCAEIMAEDRG
jgi:hypothetical protein